MTAVTRALDDSRFEPRPAYAAALLVAHEILHQVRFPEAVFLHGIECSIDAGRGLGTFLYPRSNQFPNPTIDELTGGQLIDSVTQMAYCLTGLMIHGGVELLGLDFEGYKQEIHAHRVQAVRTDIAFQQPCRIGRPFFIAARLRRFPNGELSILKHNPPRHFLRIELKGSQRPSDQGAAASDIFHARIGACRQLR